MNPSNEKWATVCDLAQASWVDAATASALRPTSAASSTPSLLAASGAPGASSGMLTLMSLRKELIEERLALHRHQAGQVDSHATSSGSHHVSSVLELVLDRMALRDCGECDGATQSPLVDYTSLRRLTLNFNHLTKVATSCVLQPLAELRELEIDFNKLASFGPLRNARLQQLALSHNTLTSITGLALPQLHTLDISHNALGRDFVTAALSSKDPSLRLPSLTSLDVSHNKLTSLEWVGCLTKLNTLRAAHNMIPSLQGIQSCLAMEELDVSHNKLRFTATTQTNNPLKAVGKTLQQLDVSFNDISSLAFFPSGALPKCWSLSIANNMFHGSKKAEEPTTGVLRGPRRGSTTASPTPSTSIFASDDIGDAIYGGDDAASRSTSARPASRGLTPSEAAAGRASVAPSQASTTTTRRGPSSDDAVTFLARLSQLFPALEALNLSNNSEEIIADASDLRFLAKCPNLTELSITGTLCLTAALSSSTRGGRVGGGGGGSGKQSHVEAVKTFLPQIEVLDGTVLVRREAAAVAVEDLESLGIHDSATLFALSKGTGSAPAQQARPTSALLRPGTSSQQKSNAIQTSKAHDDLANFQHEMEAFMHRAELSRRKVNHIMDHMQRMTAWAYHDDDPAAEADVTTQSGRRTGSAAEPAPLDMVALEADIERALVAEAQGGVADGGHTSRGDQLSDSDDDVADGVDRLDVMSGADTTPRLVSPASSSSSSAAKRQQPRPPPPKASLATKDHSSPSKKRIVERSASVQPVHAANGAPTPSGSSVKGRSSSSHATGRSAGTPTAPSSSSALYAESEAMKRIKSLPSSSFTMEQSKFKQELQMEAQKRREQLSQLAKESSAKLPAPRAKKGFSGSVLNSTGALDASTTSRPTTSHSEAGTSMVSPGKFFLLNATTGAGSSSHGVRGERVTTSTATSPPKPLTQAHSTAALSYSAMVQPSSKPSANVVQQQQRPAVPKLDFDVSGRRSPVVIPADLSAMDDTMDTTPALREPSTVVTDPRNAVKKGASQLSPATPGEDGDATSPDDLIAAMASSSRMNAPTSLNSTARPLSASMTITSGQAQLKRVDPNNGVSSVPKVTTSRKNAAFNPLLKELPAPRGGETAVVAPPVALPSSASTREDATQEEEALTYFSTKPITTSQPVIVKGGGSLNRRGQRK